MFQALSVVFSAMSPEACEVGVRQEGEWSSVTRGVAEESAVGTQIVNRALLAGCWHFRDM